VKRVIKIGGRAQASPDLARIVASAWAAQPGSFCVVHGGGDRISEFQRKVGLEPSFVDGRRITTREDMEIVRMVLSGIINKELTASFIAAGVRAVGISGEDAAMISASQIDELGRVGKPVAVKPDVIAILLDNGYLPVISPLAVEDGNPGEALNVNGDDAAAAIAIALDASELLLVADVDGVLDDRKSVIASLDHSDAAELVQKGVVSKGMKAKLEAGFSALSGGVRRVRVASLDGVANKSSGTLLTFAQSLTT
jgi:acetylglutamate kinase